MPSASGPYPAQPNASGPYPMQGTGAYPAAAQQILPPVHEVDLGMDLDEPPPPPPRTEVGTIVVEVRPPEPPPAPVPAPEPVVEAPKPPVPEKKPAPMGPKQLLAKAQKLLENGNSEAALEIFGRLASQDPSNVAALTGRGLCYLDLENLAPAEASFEAALRLEPDDADAMLGIAQAYEKQGKKAEAVAAYEKFLARHAGADEAEIAKRALEQLRK
jgi:tetratricopeptide (TPR) repeat protein